MIYVHGTIKTNKNARFCKIEHGLSRASKRLSLAISKKHPLIPLRLRQLLRIIDVILNFVKLA